MSGLEIIGLMIVGFGAAVAAVASVEAWLRRRR